MVACYEGSLKIDREVKERRQFVDNLQYLKGEVLGGSRRFECDRCGLKYSTKSRLTNHERQNHRILDSHHEKSMFCKFDQRWMVEAYGHVADC
ncbi:hypothetical protein Ciccas_000194 [Cichlidogyrus casuarinus]|uniref:C2H2-type domain-containing protein n=1 Tax=Cichlidogyrus casuarinus TaxID=1844966 RepID=A0ABD2QNL2_9PLAT